MPISSLSISLPDFLNRIHVALKRAETIESDYPYRLTAQVALEKHRRRQPGLLSPLSSSVRRAVMEKIQKGELGASSVFDRVIWQVLRRNRIGPNDYLKTDAEYAKLVERRANLDDLWLFACAELERAFTVAVDTTEYDDFAGVIEDYNAYGGPDAVSREIARLDEKDFGRQLADLTWQQYQNVAELIPLPKPMAPTTTPTEPKESAAGGAKPDATAISGEARAGSPKELMPFLECSAGTIRNRARDRRPIETSHGNFRIKKIRDGRYQAIPDVPNRTKLPSKLHKSHKP